MKKQHLYAWSGVLATLLFAALSVWPDDAEARRAGGGSSFGSRGSRSFSAPSAPSTPRQAISPTSPTGQSPTGATSGFGSTPTSRPTTATSGMGPGGRSPAAPSRGAGAMGGLGSGLMGGIGGFLLGGMIGSWLFGDSGQHAATPAGTGTPGAEPGMAEAAQAASSGGIGLLDILLIGLAAFVLFKFVRARFGGSPAPAPARLAGSGAGPLAGGPMTRGGGDTGLPSSFDAGRETAPTPQESALETGPGFDQAHFLEGARMCFQMVQQAWSDWNVSTLRPLVTDRLWNMVEQQAKEREAEGRRDITDQIRFYNADVSEAWQEAGQDWVTVYFRVSMLEYALDLEGQVVEGDPETPVEVEEFWTFCRPSGSQDPNWKLSAIQQPDEVARSVH